MSLALAEVVAVASQVTATSSRTTKTSLIAALLGGLPSEDIEVVVGLLTGAPRQRRTGVGYRGIGDLPPAAAESSLSVAAVDAAFDALESVSGAGAQTKRRRVLDAVMESATVAEQGFLVRVLLGEMRQGALEASVVAAVAVASRVPLPVVRRAVMLRGDVGAIARLALTEGESSVTAVGLDVGRAVQPMLASSAKTVSLALAGTARPRSTGSSTVSGPSCTDVGMRSGSSPAPWTRSPPVCPRWWPPCSPLWARTWCSMPS